MKKISLKMIRKSFNIKGKEDGDNVLLQQPPIPAEFSKDDALFDASYTKGLVSCDLNVVDEDGHKNRSKSDGLMGTLKRRLSTKQKGNAKSFPTSVGSEDDDDTFSSSSVPISFNEVKAQRPLRSSSLRSHHYSPTPWPFRPEKACIKMEVKVNTTVHSPNPTPFLNGIQNEFHDIQLEPLFQDQSDSLKVMETQSGHFHLDIEDHVPIGLTPQDYIQYTMPLDEGMYPDLSHTFCLDGSSAMEVANQAEPDPLHLEHGPEHMDLNQVLMEQVVNQPVAPAMILSNSRADTPLFSSPLSPFTSSEISQTLSGFSGADSNVVERVRRHLNFDPSSVPGVSRVYDSIHCSGSLVVTSLTEELKKLAKQGWYWGPITRWEAEEKLINLLDGSFLVRDSSDDRYLLSLSFRSQGKTLHTRIEHSNGRFSFYEQPDVESHTSIVDLIEHSIKDSEYGAFCYSRSRLPGSATYPVSLTNPVSRFMQVRSLQYLCRFVIRQYTRIDLIQKLPLPNKMKDYLQEKHY